MIIKNQRINDWRPSWWYEHNFGIQIGNLRFCTIFIYLEEWEEALPESTQEVLGPLPRLLSQLGSGSMQELELVVLLTLCSTENYSGHTQHCSGGSRTTHADAQGTIWYQWFKRLKHERQQVQLLKRHKFLCNIKCFSNYKVFIELCNPELDS